MALRPAERFDPALPQRAVSSVVLATGALIAVLVGGWLFILCVLCTIVVMSIEWGRLSPTGDAGARRATTLVCASVACAAVLAYAIGQPAWALALVLAGIPLSAGLAVLVPGALPDRLAGGTLYLAAPTLSLVWLRTAEPGGLAHVIWVLLVVCATDIFAYLAGRSIGGAKLAPSISPGKTWSGLAGGMLGAAVVGGAGTLLAGAGFWLGAGLGLLLAAVAQAGDLFESALKRRAGVKDSGHLIPGHGGLLDRVDGLLFAVPVFAAVVWLTRLGAPL